MNHQKSLRTLFSNDPLNSHFLQLRNCLNRCLSTIVILSDVVITQRMHKLTFYVIFLYVCVLIKQQSMCCSVHLWSFWRFDFCAPLNKNHHCAILTILFFVCAQTRKPQDHCWCQVNLLVSFPIFFFFFLYLLVLFVAPNR